MKKVSRKQFLNLTAGVGTMALLSACGTVSAEGSSVADSNTSSTASVASTENLLDPANPVTIEFWYAWTGPIEENNQAKAKEFSETIGKDLGIVVEAYYQGDYYDTHQKLQAAYIAGEAPAISVMEIASTKQFAQSGVIKNLGGYIEKDSINMDNFYAGLLENCSVDSSYYAVPFLRSTPIMYYNIDLLEAAGLGTEGPKTWDEMAEFAKTIHEELGIAGISLAAYDWTFEAFMFEHGTSILNEDETLTNLNSDEGKTIVNYFKDLSDAGYIDLYPSSGGEQINVTISNQTSAMWFGSTGSLAGLQTIADESGFKLGTCFIPAAEQHGVPTGGCNLVMTSKLTPQEEQAAWEFMKWMIAEEQAISSSMNTGYVMTQKSLLENETVLAYFEEYPQAKVALDQLEQYGYGRPMNPNYAQAGLTLNECLEAAWVNGVDVDTALADYEIKMNDILAQ